MIWIWIALGLVTLPVLALIPRVIFSGSGSPKGFLFQLKAMGLRLSYRTAGGDVGGRFLWFKLNDKTLGKHDTAEEKPPAQPVATNATKPPVRRKSSSNFALIRLLAPRILNLIKRLLGSISADEISVELIIATNDPMTTAVLYGALQPVAMLNTPRWKFIIGVDFERNSPDYNLRWAFSVRPIVWIWIVFSWAVSLPWLTLWRNYKNNK